MGKNGARVDRREHPGTGRTNDGAGDEDDVPGAHVVTDGTHRRTGRDRAANDNVLR